MEENYRNTSKSARERYLREEAYLKAERRVKKIKGFYSHLIVYILVNLFLIGTIGYLSSFNEMWNFGTFATAFFWGIGLAFHAIGVFGPNILFGKSWEERKIKEYMDKDKTRWE